VSSYEYVSAPRAVTVLPSRVGRRLTRRDGLLPLVLALELVAGVAFGLAASSGSSATGVPERMTLGSGLPSLQPVAHVVTGTTGSAALAGPTAVPAPIGPAVGPLRPGTVRAGTPAPVDVAQPAVVVPSPTPFPTHAPRNPFGVLARG
jgi:hypothetical protein